MKTRFSGRRFVPSRAGATLLAWLACLPSLIAQPGHTAGLAGLQDIPGLIATVARTDAPVQARARACQLLSLTSAHEAVPVLAPLLGDPVLGQYARTALEGMPGEPPLEALRSALKVTTGRQRLGIINSLGVRADAKAAPLLAALSREGAEAGAAEALIALARMVSAESAPAIRAQLASSDETLRAAAADAAVRLGSLLASRGQRGEATALCEAALQSEVPITLRLAALRGKVLAMGEAGLPELLGSLRGTDRARAAMALRVARELPGAVVSPALAREFRQVSPEVLPPLIGVLADRRDGSVRAEVEALVSSAVPEVRTAAVEALGKLGSAASVPVLVRALDGGDADPAADAAVASLVRLPKDGVDDALLGQLARAETKVLPRLMSVLAQRGTAGGGEILLRHAAGADAAVARAAFDALGATATPQDWPALLRVAGAVREESVRDRAERALHYVVLRVPDAPRRTPMVVAGLRSMPSAAARGSLLQVLGMLGGADAAEAVAAAYGDESPEVRATALQLLAHWSDTTAVPPLLKLYQGMREGGPRVTALEGLVTLLVPSEAASRGAVPPSAQQVSWMTEIARSVRPDAGERRVLVSGLGDLNCREGLDLLLPFLDDPAVRVPAAEALLRLAPRLGREEDRQIARERVARLAAGADAGPEVQRKAAELLPKLGR